MPYLVPRSPEDSEQVAFVLAFGKLSVLEVCAVLGGRMTELESPSERICTLRSSSASSAAPNIAGIHKFASVLTRVQPDGAGTEGFVEKVSDRVDELSNLSVSAYGVPEDDYESVLQLLLGAFRTRGFRKIHLLRPKGNELHAEQVVARGATDVIVFPYRGAFCLGLTSYVPEASDFRERGVAKPAPHSDISLSPRLARVLVNLTGIRRGQTLLDPFCGSGTILAEGMLKSIRCFGIDSRRRLIDEARRNLRWISDQSRGTYFKLRAGDARDLGATLGGMLVDGVATEPILLPKLQGRLNSGAAKELVEGAGDVYAEALASIAGVVKPGGRVVIVVPIIQTTDDSEIYVGLDGRPLGLKPFQPGPSPFQYPVRLSFESTRWIKRAVYVFEVPP